MKAVSNCKTLPYYPKPCFEIHEYNNTKRLILVHSLPEAISEIYNKFGVTRDYHSPIISYESEQIKNVVIKIIENIDENYDFYYKVFE